MKHLKIYLAGKMSGLSFEEMNGWRIELKEKLLKTAEECDCKVFIINPVDYYNFVEVKHQSESEVEDFDLYHATTSSLVIVNLNGLTTSDGTKIEIHDCNYHKRIPVIGFGSKELYESLHPWTKRDITRVDESIDAVVGYVKEFYMT